MKEQIVICRYNENDALIKHLHDNTNAEIYVYDRGPTPLNLKLNRVKHIIDENKYREHYVFLNHIINNYNFLGNKILFTQAKIDDHDRFIPSGDMAEYFNKCPMNTAFRSYYRAELICNKYGFPHHESSNLDIEKTWKLISDIEIPEYILFNPCGMFITCGDAIRNNNLDLYVKLKNSHDEEKENIMYDYIPCNKQAFVLERLWMYILDKTHIDRIKKLKSITKIN